MSNPDYARIMVEPRNSWIEFDERSRETIPRDKEPIELEFEDGEIIQGRYEAGKLSVFRGVNENELKNCEAKPKRFPYLS